MSKGPMLIVEEIQIVDSLYLDISFSFDLTLATNILGEIGFFT